MNVKIVTVLFILIINFGLSQGRRYDHYVLFQAFPLEQEHLKFLQYLENQNYIDLIYWKKPAKLYETVQLIVSPKDIEKFMERCKHYGLKVEEVNTNVQELFDAQRLIRRYTPSYLESYTWDQYHTLGDIYQWMTDLANKHQQFCELIRIGKTTEKRDIYALSISRQKNSRKVIVEGGMHGNEWISMEFVTYLIHNLLKNANGPDYRLTEAAVDFHWFLVPVANPDGYEYSREYDRLWRKNRKYFEDNTTGVDLNRNFDYSFGKFSTSNDTRHDHYCGSSPFSEAESVALSKFITDQSKNLLYYFSIHAYGQKFIIPFGDKILHVNNYAECENYGKQAIQKIYKKTGMKYSIGNSYDTLGRKISGSSADWVKHTFDVPYVYTFLLRDTGKYGYGMPPHEIIPTCEETLTAVLEIMTTRVKKLRADIFSDSSDRRNEASCGMVLSVVAICLSK